MKRNWIAAVGMSLLVATLPLGVAAQDSTPAETAEKLGHDVAGIHQSLARLVELLESVRDNQKVELIIRRIELKERRQAPLEQRLRSAESRHRGIQEEIEEIQTMREQVEDQIADDVRTGRDELDGGNRKMLEEIEMRLQMLAPALERAITQMREHEDELAARRKEIAILDEMLEEFLE